MHCIVCSPVPVAPRERTVWDVSRGSKELAEECLHICATKQCKSVCLPLIDSWRYSAENEVRHTDENMIEDMLGIKPSKTQHDS